MFRTLCRLFKVDAADYMMSLCGNDALRELSSPGKSGSFFYVTNDDRYMIKTMKKSEVKVSFFAHWIHFFYLKGGNLFLIYPIHNVLFYRSFCECFQHIITMSGNLRTVW